MALTHWANYRKNLKEYLHSEKTQTIWLGSKINCKMKYMPHLNIIWNPDKFQILGVWFSTNLKECEHLNYDEKLSEVKLLFKM